MTGDIPEKVMHRVIDHYKRPGHYKIAQLKAYQTPLFAGSFATDTGQNPNRPFLWRRNLIALGGPDAYKIRPYETPCSTHNHGGCD
jgi:hypothetical protein